MSTWLLVLFSTSYTTSCSTRDVALYTCILFGRKNGGPRKPIAFVRMGLRIRSVLFCEASSSSISEKHSSIGFKETKLGSTPRLIRKASGSGASKTNVASALSENLSSFVKGMSCSQFLCACKSWPSSVATCESPLASFPVCSSKCCHPLLEVLGKSVYFSPLFSMSVSFLSMISGFTQPRHL